jgi:hypothetical protein
MRRSAILLAVVVLGAIGSAAWALYLVSDRGEWPESWPQELEPLRKQARTFEGPKRPDHAYAISFSKREEFEAAWPHLLKVKNDKTPIHLQRGENFFLGDAKAGVVVYCPAARSPEVEGRSVSRIDLRVDGEIVDLNRIPLPEGRPIVDERFKEEK